MGTGGVVDAAAVGYRLKKLDRRVTQVEDALLTLGETDAGLLLAALQDYASLEQLGVVSTATTALQSAIATLTAQAASNATAVNAATAATNILITNEAADDITVSQLQTSVNALNASQIALATTVSTHDATLAALSALQTTVTTQQAQIATMTATLSSLQSTSTNTVSQVGGIIQFKDIGFYQNLAGAVDPATGGRAWRLPGLIKETQVASGNYEHTISRYYRNYSFNVQRPAGVTGTLEVSALLDTRVHHTYFDLNMTRYVYVQLQASVYTIQNGGTSTATVQVEVSTPWLSYGRTWYDTATSWVEGWEMTFGEGFTTTNPYRTTSPKLCLVCSYI